MFTMVTRQGSGPPPGLRLRRGDIAGAVLWASAAIGFNLLAASAPASAQAASSRELCEVSTLSSDGSGAAGPSGAPGGAVIDESHEGQALAYVRACAPGDWAVASQGHAFVRFDLPDGAFSPPTTIGRIAFLQWDPCRVPGGTDLPDAKFEVRFVSQEAADASRTFTLGPDKGKPKLTTTSQPAKGTKVRPGDSIKITMLASEKYEDAGNNWQTGVKSIRLREVSRNEILPHWENTGGPLPCDRKQWQQRLEVTYTVPPNPPPVIRLRASAQDFAGNEDFDLGEFPVRGDWSGTLSLSAITPTLRQTMLLDVTLNDDGRGNLTGHMAGESAQVKTGGYACPFRTTPAQISAKLVGEYTPGRNTMSLTITDRNVVQGEWECVPPGAEVSREHFVGKHGQGMVDQPLLDRLLRSLSIAADGAVQASDEDSRFAAQGIAIKATLELRRAEN